MKNKNAAYGALFILLAAYLIVSKMDLIPQIPVLKIVITGVLAYIAIRGIIKLEFFQFFMPIAIIGCQYDTYLGIEKLTPWTLLVTAALISVGCELLFQNKKYKIRRWSYNKKHPSFNFNSNPNVESNTGKSDFQTVMKEDGEYINVSNGFGETSRYIDSSNFRYAEIDNGFGKCLVYFNNCTVLTEARIDVNNGMGKADIYVPGNWRIDLHTENGLGNVHLKGEPSQDPSAPLVHLNINNGLGTVDVTVV